MAGDKLFQRPLYAFDIPDDLLKSLQVKSQQSAVDAGSSVQDTAAAATQSDVQTGSSTATSCALCGLTFTSVVQQRSHVRSDLHGYNLKQKLKGRKPVSEAQFDQLIGELDESISGSDSSNESDDEDDADDGNGTPDEGAKKDMLSALLKRQAKLGDQSEEPDPTAVVSKRRRGAGKPPLVWFSSSTLPSNTSLGLYRAIFSSSEQDNERNLVQALQAKQLGHEPSARQPASKPNSKTHEDDEDDDDGGVPLPGAINTKNIKAAGPHYFLCMIGGGHFAAMLVALTPKVTKKGLIDDRSASVIAHKTFHRYTTRRKQGGSQSANDNSKGNAHSAGSSLRRYNEAALETDVRSLLTDWKAWVESSELLFIRATGTTNRKILFGPYDGQVLSQRDNRVRGFPFNTRRATQSELMRAFIELTRIKVSTIDEEALAQKAAEEADRVRVESQQAQNRKSTPVKAKISKDDETAILHTTQLQALIKRSKVPALISYFTSNSLSPDFRFHPPERNHHAPTALHLAAASNAPACITALLVRVGTDPSIENGEGRTAFELAGDRATRDAFSLSRGQLGEQKWSWDMARVPAAISQQEADRRAVKEKEEKLAEESTEKARREAELKRMREEDREKQSTARDKKFGAGKSLGAAPMTAEQRRMEDAKGMTDEMRLKVERERRARAAEERMKRLQNT